MPKKPVILPYGTILRHRHYNVFPHFHSTDKLYCHWSLDSGPWVIALKREILIFEIEYAFHIRILLHDRKLARLTRKLQGNLLEMIAVNVSVTCGMNEISRLQASYLGNHHRQKSI